MDEGQPMRYLSVCSGIEAATMAWHDLGWTPAGFSEIEPFPSAVLAHHYPNVTNFGDMTKYKEWNLDGSIDLLVGGTPCQSFSVAGLRKGMDDPRGNLALVYCGMLDHFRPNWFVWENVPGVLSSSGGRDFGSFLGAVAQLGYGFAYRVLDAQYCGVAQRRRRVFVVGYLGDWRPAAAVLFERNSLRRDTAPSRSERQGTAGGFVPSLANTLQTTCNDYSRADGFNMIAYENHPADSRVREMGETCQTVTSRWGTGGGNVPLVQEAYGFTQCDAARDVGNNISPTLRSGGDGGYPNHSVAIGVDVYNYSETGELAATFGRNSGGTNTAGPKVMQNMAVRRLTPTECERLQGFPDGFTNIPWRKKDTSPDGPRYKALGNSMAVPCMQWIGDGIDLVDKL
jgi:DNA (cytosine-5)-methyltransferase 1